MNFAYHVNGKVSSVRKSSLLLLIGASIATCLMMSTSAFAEGAGRIEAPPGLPKVPVTKILAIGSYTAKATTAALKPILPNEVRETARLYLAGKLDQWYFTPDNNAVVFILNVTDVQEAHAMLEKLPLGQAGLMEFQLTRLAPLAPLGALMGPSAP